MSDEFLNLQVMEDFNEKCLPDLSTAVLGALELFDKNGFSKTIFPRFKRPLIVGSGNAIVTAKVLFEEKDALFADETNYKACLRKRIDGVIIFSASGGKHAPIIAKDAKNAKKKVFLVTCNPKAPAISIVGKGNYLVTLKNREPYTYNTSTYMGWLFAKSHEDPKKIQNFILENIAPKLPKNFSKYTGFLLVTPDKFSGLNQLFIVKFIELFGRVIARDVKSFEELKHAITVVPSKKELCIAFGKEKIDFVGEKLTIDIPSWIGPAGFMAIVYYVIGEIQKQLPQYFIDNIPKYIKRNSKGDFGKVLDVIVE